MLSPVVPMTDPFSTLPPSLVLLILKSSLDLPSLDALIQASPVAAGIFEECYDEITEAGISSTLSPTQQRLVRTIIALRTDDSIVKASPESPEALDSFLESYVYGDAGDRPLSKTSARLSVVRSVLSLASDVEGLFQSFFEVHLKRVNAITPSYIVRTHFSYSYTPLDDHPEGCSYQPAKCGPPSWVEAERVYRALWRIQLYYDLVPYIEPESGPLRIWGQLEYFKLDEMQCVYDHIQEIQPSDSHPADLQRSPPRLPTMTSPNVTQRLVVQAPPEDYDTALAWLQAVKRVNHPSPGCHFFHVACLRNRHSPLAGTSFRPFRRIGFGIWDLQKMAGLGMLWFPNKFYPSAKEMLPVGPPHIHPTLDNLFFRWKSVVSTELDNLGTRPDIFFTPRTINAA